MSEPGASPRLLRKDTAAPGSPGSPSIHQHRGQIPLCERKEFSPPPESGRAEGRRPDLRVGWIRFAFAAPGCPCPPVPGTELSPWMGALRAVPASSGTLPSRSPG